MQQSKDVVFHVLNSYDSKWLTTASLMAEGYSALRILPGGRKLEVVVILSVQ